MIRARAGLPSRPPAVPAGNRQKGADMATKGHRPSWEHVERAVRLALRISAEVVRLIIELRGGR